jgi:hypothetical protein
MKWTACPLIAALALAAGCEPAPRKPPQAAHEQPSHALLPGAADDAHDAPRPPLQQQDEDENLATDKARVQQMLERVASARGLPVLRPVTSRVLDRPAIRQRIVAHIEREIPPEIVAHQGEALAALELVPADYDFVTGMLKLVEGRIAGFYEPEDRTMYLADDLSDDEAVETLAHELVHALQDQSFPLRPMLRFSEGDSDRTAAAHAVIEGDAMSAMLDVVTGSAFNLSETAMRRLISASTALSLVGMQTPKFLQSTLNAPYTDGFALVQEFRRRGGWPAVDAVWRAMPETTEQLLHPDKLDAREPAMVLQVPPLDVLGADFRAVFDDVMGEQGLRMVLEQWANHQQASAAASGWGGDRFVVARRDGPNAPRQHEIALAWHLRMDTPADAAEVGSILKASLGGQCRARPALGPFVWKARGRDIAVAAGPYMRDGATAKGGGSCAAATRWVEAILAAGSLNKR